MSELCGPSNALQTFQKYTSVDRTLQQDRRAPLQPPPESFRSRRAPDPAIEAEFQAFVNSKPPDPSIYLNSPFEQPLHHPNLQYERDAPAWASDFQNLDLSREAPLPSSQFRHLAPLQRPPSSSWREEFIGRASSSSIGSPLAQQAPHANTLQRTGPFSTPFYQAGTPATTFSTYGQEPTFETAPEEAEAFAKAFEEAEQSIATLASEAQSHSKAEDPIPTAAQDPIDAQPISYRIGSDLISDASQRPKSDAENRNDDDELAKVAGNLLENVKDDTSAKFRNSNFLTLMRQLRDREVRVEGENIVNVAQDLHPGGSGYPQVGEAEQPMFAP